MSSKVCMSLWFEFVGALQDRLLDFDDRVRVVVVPTICDLAITDSKWVPTDLLIKVAERLRDKKVWLGDCISFLCFSKFQCFFNALSLPG